MGREHQIVIAVLSSGRAMLARERRDFVAAGEALGLSLIQEVNDQDALEFVDAYGKIQPLKGWVQGEQARGTRRMVLMPGPESTSCRRVAMVRDPEASNHPCWELRVQTESRGGVTASDIFDFIEYSPQNHALKLAIYELNDDRYHFIEGRDWSALMSRASANLSSLRGAFGMAIQQPQFEGTTRDAWETIANRRRGSETLISHHRFEPADPCALFATPKLGDVMASLQDVLSRAQKVARLSDWPDWDQRFQTAIDDLCGDQPPSLTLARLTVGALPAKALSLLQAHEDAMGSDDLGDWVFLSPAAEVQEAHRALAVELPTVLAGALRAALNTQEQG